MGFSDDQIHDILELKEQFTEEIEKHLEEIEKLEKNISILNTILKQTSFTKASDLTLNTEKKKDVVPIIKNSDGSTIANVFVSDDQLSIVLDKNISTYLVFQELYLEKFQNQYFEIVLIFEGLLFVFYLDMTYLVSHLP